MQILYFWGLTSSEETKGHTAEEPDGHDREGQMGRSPAQGPREHEQRSTFWDILPPCDVSLVTSLNESPPPTQELPTEMEATIIIDHYRFIHLDIPC